MGWRSSSEGDHQKEQLMFGLNQAYGCPGAHSG